MLQLCPLTKARLYLFLNGLCFTEEGILLPLPQLPVEGMEHADNKIREPHVGGRGGCGAAESPRAPTCPHQINYARAGIIFKQENRLRGRGCFPAAGCGKSHNWHSRVAPLRQRKTDGQRETRKTKQKQRHVSDKKRWPRRKREGEWALNQQTNEPDSSLWQQTSVMQHPRWPSDPDVASARGQDSQNTYRAT